MSSADEDDIRVLHVDDDDGIGDVVAMQLERQRERLSVVTESSAEDGLDRLAADDVDCVVSDHDMPEKNGLEFLRDVRQSYPELPFILFTGKGSEEIASDAISAGVTEYLQKGTGSDQYAVLANRIERAVAANRAERALEESRRRLSTLISNLPGMVYRCQNERGWPMTFVSDGARDLTGYSAAALESGDVNWADDVLHEADREEMWEAVQAAIDADEPFEVTYRIETADGEIRWVWERGRVVDTTDGSEVIEGFITDITTRRERERELRDEREFTEDVINSLNDVFYVVSVDGEFLRWNDRLTEVTGYSDEEIAEMDVFDFFPEEYHETLTQSTKRAIRSDEVAAFEAELETMTGERVHFEFRGRALEDPDGDVTGVCGVGRDISERKARERELEQYRTLVESVGDPMYATDADQIIVMVNEAMACHLGDDRAELIGESVAKFATDESVERANELIEGLLAGDESTWATFEMQTITADGTRRDNEDMIAVLTDDEERFQGTVGVIRDISDRKQRERELERYETIIQAVGDPVYTLDEDGVFTFVNEAMESLSGYDREDLLGSHVSMLMTDEDVLTGEETIRELLGDDDATNATIEMDVLAQEGESIPSENHIALLPLDDDEFRGTAGVLRDITERKEREQRLEEFASVVSHDLRNPLNVVQGRIQLALEDESVANLGAARDAAERMERLIDDLLRLARQDRDLDRVQSVAIADVATDAWNHLVTDGATLSVESTRTVEADPDRLGELFENLLRNALEHGSTSPHSSSTREDAIQHGTRGDDGQLSVRVGDTDDGFFVEDDGVGIDPDRREEIFERGYTTSSDGTGFGLAIVESVASAHDWEISATESTLASGVAGDEVVSETDAPDDAPGARFEITF